MNDSYQSSMSISGKVVPFLLSQSSTPSRQPKNKLAGFAKVLAGGRVVGLNKEKPFADRMIADGVDFQIQDAGLDDPKVEQIILESVATNLEAGVKMLDKQEVTLARMGGRLSEMALSLNRAAPDLSQSNDAQSQFEESRHHFRMITKETFDHTALFSMGPSKPITIAVPVGKVWEGLSIDRCNLKTQASILYKWGKLAPLPKAYCWIQRLLHSYFKSGVISVLAIDCSGIWFTTDGRKLFPRSSIFWAVEGGLPTPAR